MEYGLATSGGAKVTQRYCRPRTVLITVRLFSLAGTKIQRAFALASVMCVALVGWAQQTQTAFLPDSPSIAQKSAGSENPLLKEAAVNETAAATAVIVPAGARIALVLTHPIQSRYIHRGDDIYAQVTSPVNSGNEVVIPPGTFVQGKVDKLERKGGRGELHLQSMSFTYPDGYVAPISGPVTLESDDGYALKDPGQGRIIGGFALPAAGLGLGALIGRAAASSRPTTITNTLPPGCMGPPPGCLTSSVSGPPNRVKAIAIGSIVGLAAGGIASVALIFNSHNFFLDVGSPVEMVLQQSLRLDQDEVGAAVKKSEQHPVAEQPIAPRPVPPPLPADNTDHGTCYTPGTPGTPDTVIPGTPPIGDSPGTPPTVIPGMPATPGTPYPCP
jgi:hypothetical protein